jgi:hypothetical protein
VCQLHVGGNILVDARIGELSASDVVQDLTAVAFHQKCPISPNWAHSPDGWSNMQQSMNCEWASCNTAQHMLIVNSVDLLNGIWQRKKLIPFILLDPLLETSLKVINLSLGNFDFKTKRKKLNQLNEVFVILFIDKPAIKKSRGEIHCPN